jgi:hypothetical protein
VCCADGELQVHPEALLLSTALLATLRDYQENPSCVSRIGTKHTNRSSSLPIKRIFRHNKNAGVSFWPKGHPPPALSGKEFFKDLCYAAAPYYIWRTLSAFIFSLLNVFYRLFFLSLSSFFLFLVHRYSFFYLPKADMSLPCGGGGVPVIFPSARISRELAEIPTVSGKCLCKI